MESLFGEMWEGLEVPASPPLVAYGEITPSTTPSPPLLPTNNDTGDISDDLPQITLTQMIDDENDSQFYGNELMVIPPTPTSVISSSLSPTNNAKKRKAVSFIN